MCQPWDGLSAAATERRAKHVLWLVVVKTSPRSLWLKVVAVMLLLGAATVPPIVYAGGFNSGFFDGGDGGIAPFWILIFLLIPASVLASLEWEFPKAGGVAVAVVGLLTGILLWRVFTAWGTFDGDTGPFDGDTSGLGTEVIVLLALGVAPLVSGLLCVAAAQSDRAAQSV